MSLINHSATNSSSTLARHGVKEIGLKSDSLLGSFSLEIDEMWDAFQSEGTIPVAENGWIYEWLDWQARTQKFSVGGMLPVRA